MRADIPDATLSYPRSGDAPGRRSIAFSPSGWLDG